MKDDQRIVNADYADRLEAELHQSRHLAVKRAMAIDALEAARDHLRARLRELIAQWRRAATLTRDTNNDAYNAGLADGEFSCISDLLAILSEPEEAQQTDITLGLANHFAALPLARPPQEEK